jgi:PAS domain S-box-containing protein
VEVRGCAELKELAAAFNTMAGEIGVREEALRESEQHFRNLADSGRSLIWTSGTDKRVNYVNQPWLSFTNRTLEQELGEGWYEGVHPDDLERCLETYTSAFDRRERFSLIYRMRRHDGAYRWIQDDGTPRYDANGHFIGYIGHCLDITELKQAEEAISESERFSRSTVNALSANIAILDENGFILRTNRSWQVFAASNGLSSNPDLIGANYLSICDQATGEWAEEAPIAASGIRDVIAGRRDAWQLEYPCHSPDEQRWFRMRVTRFEDSGPPVRVVVAHENITEQKTAEESMRLFPSRLLAAQEEERKRIAHELHDSIGGSLSAIKIGLEDALQRMEDGVATPECIEGLIAATGRTIEEARRIYANLRPAMLDDLGLLPTLRWLCREFEALHHGVRIEEHIEVEEEDIPESLKIVVFRVVQESFHNIAKYSKADLVRVSLSGENGLIGLLIADNGVGFDVHSAYKVRDEKGGLGLTSMRERVEISGGAFTIESAPGSGARIRASWPYFVSG